MNIPDPLAYVNKPEKPIKVPVFCEAGGTATFTVQPRTINDCHYLSRTGFLSFFDGCEALRKKKCVAQGTPFVRPDCHVLQAYSLKA